MASTNMMRTKKANALNSNQRILILPNCNAAAKSPNEINSTTLIRIPKGCRGVINLSMLISFNKRVR